MQHLPTQFRKRNYLSPKIGAIVVAFGALLGVVVWRQDWAETLGSLLAFSCWVTFVLDASPFSEAKAHRATAVSVWSEAYQVGKTAACLLGLFGLLFGYGSIGALLVLIALGCFTFGSRGSLKQGTPPPKPHSCPEYTTLRSLHCGQPQLVVTMQASDVELEVRGKVARIVKEIDAGMRRRGHDPMSLKMLAAIETFDRWGFYDRSASRERIGKIREAVVAVYRRRQFN